MIGVCHIDCPNRTELGYCKTTYCIIAPTIRVSPSEQHNYDRVVDAYHFNEFKDDTTARTKTQFDRIQGMSVENFASWMAHRGEICPPGHSKDDWNCRLQCERCWRNWLNEEIAE